MSTGEVVAVSVSALAGGGFLAGSLIVRGALGDLSAAVREGYSAGYSATASVSVKPPSPPKPGTAVTVPAAAEASPPSLPAPAATAALATAREAA